MQGSLLSQIANPPQVDIIGSLAKGQALGQRLVDSRRKKEIFELEKKQFTTKQEDEDRQKQAIQTFSDQIRSGAPSRDAIKELSLANPDLGAKFNNLFGGMETAALKETAMGMAAAFSAPDEKTQNNILRNTAKIAPPGSALSESLNSLIETPYGLKRNEELLQSINFSQNFGLLPKPPKKAKAEKTAGQIERGVRVAEGELDVKEKRLLQGGDNKPLKLEKLISKRNSLPADSQDIKLYDQAIAKEVKMPGQAIERPFTTKLMANGWMPSGRITSPMLNAFEAAAKKANEMGKPLTVDDMRTMDFEATKNRSTGRAAGSRMVIARKQNIEAAQGLLSDLKITANKLNYSPVKFIGMLEKWKKGQLNDPVFTEYMTQRADSLFVLGNALKQNGLTDKSIEVEEEAFSPQLAPKAFNAWFNTQVRAINRAASEMNKDYGFGISLSPAFSAGQGGAPTAEQPLPVLPDGESSAETIGGIQNLSDDEIDALINQG